MKHTRQVNIRMDDALHGALKRVAKDNKQSLNKEMVDRLRWSTQGKYFIQYFDEIKNPVWATRKGKRIVVNPFSLALFVALVASSVPARASPECKTFVEARAAYPNTHIWYHVVGGVRCWDDKRTARSPRSRHRPSAPASMPVPVPRSTVLWPSLASTATPVDAALYNATQMTTWPLLLDVDEATAPVADASGNDAAQDICCWPVLEVEFGERWSAVPATWFFSALKLELKP